MSNDQIPAEYLDGDFQPMEPFSHYHGLAPRPREKTFLETVAEVETDEDVDMMEFVQTQESVKSMVS